MTVIDKLIWSVRALAQPASVQRKLFPAFVVVADELALEFEEHYPPALAASRDLWSGDQLSKLRALEQRLEAMSGEGSGIKDERNGTPLRYRTAETPEKIQQPLTGSIAARLE